MHHKPSASPKANAIAEAANAHLEWLDTRPYREELLHLLQENGIEDEADAHAVADAVIDLVDTPDVVVIRMAHYAGELEARGEISAPEWADLSAAIQVALISYYAHPSSTNPFHLEDVIDKVLRERFPITLASTIRDIQTRAHTQSTSSQREPPQR